MFCDAADNDQSPLTAKELGHAVAVKQCHFSSFIAILPVMLQTCDCSSSQCQLAPQGKMEHAHHDWQCACCATEQKCRNLRPMKPRLVPFLVFARRFNEIARKEEKKRDVVLSSINYLLFFKISLLILFLISTTLINN